MAIRLCIPGFALGIAVFCAASGSAVAQGAAEKSQRPNVVIVGASLSAGFADPTSKGPDGEINRTYNLKVAFKKAWPTDVARISNFGDMMMFLQPGKRGQKQVDMAQKRRPDLLIGIDFLTWFGYGSLGGNAKDGETHPRRLALQKRGLAMLENFKCPIILGDYPDMHGASSHMLPGTMVPNFATLKALNENLREWAKARKNVHVFPLAQFVKEAVNKEQEYPFGDATLVFPKNFFLQSDRLHATRLGTLVVVLRVAETLHKILPAHHPLLQPKVTFKTLVEAAGLEHDLPTRTTK